MTINTVKYLANIETPTVYTGYLVNGARITDIGSGDRYEVGVDEWMSGNIGTELEPEYRVPEDAYTFEQLDTHQIQKSIADKVTQVNAIIVEYLGFSYSGSEDNQTKMVTAMQVLEGKNDVHTRNFKDINGIMHKLTRDDFDNLLGLIEPIYETITDS